VEKQCYIFCVSVALVIQHSKRMSPIVLYCIVLYCIVLYCHLWPVLFDSILTHNLINSMIIGEIKFVENKMCVLIFSTNFSEIFLILRKIQRDIILNLRKSSC
jgi:hypothetical protein